MALSVKGVENFQYADTLQASKNSTSSKNLYKFCYKMIVTQGYEII